MTSTETIAHALPHALPDDPDVRLVLFAIRRLGAQGLNDACAAHAFVTAFGEGFRRPLVLMRAFMLDVASAAAQPISIAPCCCQRTTASEAALLDVLARAETNPEKARLLLADQLGTRAVDGVLASAAAVAAAFADAGRPILR
ncbi:MAG TPA: DUF6628 family protein [Sphingomonas sp.]|nr:DUF6628 family protein [Sphingomonas sp.]